MSDSKPIIAVVTAVAGSFAERELLRGIISENQKNGYSTVVLSNIYNVVQQDAYLECERRIYELVYSQQIRGVILFCESFVEERARKALAAILSKLDVPIIGIGAELEEFASLPMPRLNTDDVRELEALTDHLIDVHGFTDILMLTGMPEVNVSHDRAEGFTRSLRKHGIAPDRSKIIFGDFWYTSGQALAEQLLSGERPLPQAVLCANDQMAYGLLSRFSESSIRVPQDITVISYEYSDHRLYYSPALTCCRRDRVSLGTAAAKRLHAMLAHEPLPKFVPPTGTMVFGASCPCPQDISQSLQEQRDAAAQRSNHDLNLFSSMEYRMTLCRDMEELVRIIGDHQWMIRGKRSMYLRLYTDWYDPDADPGNAMQSRCILPWQDTSVFEQDRFDLAALFAREPGAAVCYFAPVFSGNKLFGDMALLFDDAQSYDDIFRSWLKSVSIGLEFLRLKNDIRHLLSCQSVSEYRDTLTGMYNEKGFRRICQAAQVQSGKALYCVMLRILPDMQTLRNADIARKTDAILAAARAVETLSSQDAAAHLREDTFACLLQSTADAETISDLLGAILLQEHDYLSFAGSDSFACAAIPCEGKTFAEITDEADARIQAQCQVLAAHRKVRRYQQMAAVRDQIYTAPEITFEQDRDIIGTELHDAFRVNYKKCFGISFHQDCIAARLARAKAELVASDLNIGEISEQIGYMDQKYFYRQFSAAAGMTAMQYRELFRG